jgi:hypothetical protein
MNELIKMLLGFLFPPKPVPHSPSLVTPKNEPIALQDILGPNVKLEDQEVSVQNNLLELHKRINSLLSLYGKSVKVTSGLRTKEDHLRIYSNINKKRQTEGKPEVNIPWGSQHLKGNAVDIHDPYKTLQLWTSQNVHQLERIGLWCEDFSATENWVHYQIVPPNSGSRFFKP